LSGNGDALEDAARFGVALLPSDLPAEPTLGVWPDNRAAVEAWLCVDTQLRLSPVSALLGLDYAGARAGLDALGVDVTPELWRDILLIEAGARREWNENRS